MGGIGCSPAAQKVQNQVANLDQPTVGPDDNLEKMRPGAPDPDHPQEFLETTTGLKYRVLRQGKGISPQARDQVNVHYKGWLDDGFIFDSSYRRGEPISFPLTGVIPGWTEGLQLVGEGGMIELDIPSDLGYGDTGMGEIPPRARLHFIVELNRVF
ncbi:MAG: FKBP-type peptidyl-prolyl cis-trans isomerase [Planctomycetales bacterium]|nr:FKBP-type peptidyl-prolyl cis-trans isomerase [Planctomycetales bacterium]